MRVTIFRLCRSTRLMRTCLSCSTSRSRRAPTLARSGGSVWRAEARNGWDRCARMWRGRHSSRHRGLKIKRRPTRHRGRCLGTCRKEKPGCLSDSVCDSDHLRLCGWPRACVVSIGPLGEKMGGKRGYSTSTWYILLANLCASWHVRKYWLETPGSEHDLPRWKQDDGDREDRRADEPHVRVEKWFSLGQAVC